MGERSLFLFSFQLRLTTCFSGSFIKVANETMCRPIRTLTEAKGHTLAKHMYVVFSWTMAL